MKIDLTGKTFGKLTVLSELGRSRSGQVVWICSCACGGTAQVRGNDLRRGNSTSCGCSTIASNRERMTKHGQTRSPEWRSWMQMRRRCSDPGMINYGRYGGAGIRVCERWDDFEAFLEDMGPKPTSRHTLDRINSAVNYTPDNCRWATPSEQALNRRPRKRTEARL